MSEPLTLAEAVPLGTVHLQRLLAAAGIRSLVIKGPAFVELGVRKARQSNDIDLLVAPGDRDVAIRAVVAGGWSGLSPWYPRTLDDVTYSMTFCHPQFPVTVDLHHHFAGLLSPDAFDVLWRRRGTVDIAHREVQVPHRTDAFVIEALNALKSRLPGQWASVAERVIEHAGDVSADDVVGAAQSLGAMETASPVIEALGDPVSLARPSAAYVRWANEAGHERPRVLLVHLLRRAPWAIPCVVWSRVTPRGVGVAVGMRGQAATLEAYPRLLARRIQTVIARLHRRVKR